MVGEVVVDPLMTVQAALVVVVEAVVVVDAVVCPGTRITVFWFLACLLLHHGKI